MGSCGTMNGDQIAYNGFHMIRPQSPTWFDARVFYVRVANDLIDDSAPESLKLNHIPLHPETLLEVNGKRCSLSSDGISSLLRRHRVDKKSEEVTFVSTDSVRFTGSVKFEVFNRDNLVLSGVLELENKNWCLRCKSELVACTSFLKADEYAMPVIEVYAAGCVSGVPIILTETLRHKSQKNAYFSPGMDLQGASEEYRSYKMASEEEDVSLYWTREYSDEEGGELTWFNAGVRVGVGIGLGVCLGVGLSVGLLLRTYQTTTRTLRRRFL